MDCSLFVSSFCVCYLCYFQNLIKTQQFPKTVCGVKSSTHFNSNWKESGTDDWKIKDFHISNFLICFDVCLKSFCISLIQFKINQIRSFTKYSLNLNNKLTKYIFHWNQSLVGQAGGNYFTVGCNEERQNVAGSINVIKMIHSGLFLLGIADTLFLSLTHLVFLPTHTHTHAFNLSLAK